MTRYELASEITKAAIENKVIHFDNTSYADKDKIKEQNDFNAKQITNFCNSIYDFLCSI